MLYNEKVVDITDGINTIAVSHLLYTYKKLQNKVNVVFDGLGGNSLGGSHIPGLLYHIKQNMFKYEMASRYKNSGIFSDSIFLKIFNKSYNRMLMSIFYELFDKELDNCNNESPVNRLETYIYKTRYRRLSIMGDVIMRSNFEIALPFMDNNVVETILSMKPTYRKNYRAYRDFFLELSPELSKIEYFNKKVIDQILKKHISGETNYSNQLNYLVTFSIFYNKYFK